MSEYLTPIQMLVFTIITMLYIPCLSTIVVIKRHEGSKFAAQVSLFQMILGIGVGGLLRWIYEGLHSILPDLSDFGVIIWTFFVCILLLTAVIKYLVVNQKKNSVKAKNGVCLEERTQ